VAGRLHIPRGVRRRTKKEIKEDKVVLMNNKKEVKERIPNDYVFVLIGSEWPRKFLTGSGVRIIIGKESAQQLM
jgi:thioredoxin reductase